MAKKDSAISGFDSLSDILIPAKDRTMPTEVDTEPTVTQEEIERQMKEFDKPSKTKVKDAEPKGADKKPTKPVVVEDDDDEEEVEDELDEEDEDVDDVEDISADDVTSTLENKKDTNKKGKNVTEVDVEEEELVDAFSDIFAEELGWEYGEGEKPTDIKGLVKFMNDLVETASQPKYASDEIKELDDFVKNGGDVKNFLKSIYSDEIDVDKIDITKETNQKAVIRKNLRDKGFTEARIEKLVNRYEETGALEEEAEDSLIEIKENEEKGKKKLLETQKKEAERISKEQQSFVSNVEKTIKELDEVMGVPVTSKKKAELLAYIFKPEKDGMTKYQKDYNSNLKNLAVSAFLTMEGDNIPKAVQKKATTSAIKNLKLKIKSKGKSTTNTESDQDHNSKVAPLWEIMKGSGLYS